MAMPIKLSFSREGLGFAIWGRAGEIWKLAKFSWKKVAVWWCQELHVSLDPVLCLLLLSAPANCGILLQLFGTQTWHAESALARCVWVDSVWLDGKEPRQSHTWNFIFCPYTLQSQIPNLLLSMWPTHVWIPSQHLWWYWDCKGTSNKAECVGCSLV